MNKGREGHATLALPGQYRRKRISGFGGINSRNKLSSLNPGVFHRQESTTERIGSKITGLSHVEHVGKLISSIATGKSS